MTNKWKKNITLFLSGQAISLFGSSLVQYAIMWYITLQTKSGIMMTLSIIAGFIPLFVLSPFAGVWADRYNRKRLIIIADAIIAFATLIVAVVFMLGYNDFWLLFLVSFIRALGQGIQTPAIGAILPQLVPEDKLLRVNGINGSIQAFVNLVSPMVSGALLTLVSIELIFFIDVITAVIAIVILATIPVTTHAKALEAATVRYFHDMMEGIKYIRSNRYIKRYFLFTALFFILITPAAFLTPLQVTRNYGDEVWRLTVIEITFSGGMMLGGALMASWGGFRNRVHTMIISALGMGLCTIGLGVIPMFSFYSVVMLLFGLDMPVFNTPAVALLQEKVEENYLGRVFGVQTMIHSSMMPLGMLIFGPLSDYITIESMLIVTGILMLIIGILVIGDKEFISAGLPEP